MPFHSFFLWCDGTALARAIRDSRFLFPIVESIHILALTVLLGTVIVVSLRLLGAGLTQRPAAEVYGALAGLRNGALATMLVTGFLLFSSEAIKCYENPPFWAKMITLLVAIVFQYTVVRSTAARPAVSVGRFRAATAACLSLFLWFGVGVAGRAIGFY
jgi:hypothetical protein